jgi:protein TonB
LQRFIAENITFPSMALENDIQGKIIAMFVVNRLGKLNHLETCNKTLGFGLEKESMRVLEATSYLWTPAIINGFPANMRFRIPVKYQIF